MVDINEIKRVVNSMDLCPRYRAVLIDALNQGAGQGMNELETKVDDLDKEVGEVKNGISDINTKLDNLNISGDKEIVELAIGDTDEIKAANLELLGDTQHTFFANINYGYGTGSWLPTDGGNAFIITDEGHAVTYAISVDGAVTKQSEFTISNNEVSTATKQTPGTVKAITNIVNINTETATAASVAGVINTLLTQFRAAGIIQL